MQETLDDPNARRQDDKTRRNDASHPLAEHKDAIINTEKREKAVDEKG